MVGVEGSSFVDVPHIVFGETDLCSAKSMISKVKNTRIYRSRLKFRNITTHMKAKELVGNDQTRYNLNSNPAPFHVDGNKIHTNLDCTTRFHQP
ncbi:MAG: hypothetical protein A3I91_04330 [Candidatus Kerfeldbacteria bacterium RIFCSPLOWO2_02_FULL_42_19]|nr:MAG: hypothetical protein A3I91_04330 [Candidatus Kerfeldbacteria bacterium RIFCSPLOWO2_02_FULL_42_19]OGY87146.1 MAG: hypothetical protein A3G01_04680 [Candidatus Kerfeldbacteria bacterium RIFCSPLOWO2_12_FULL_43_9]